MNEAKIADLNDIQDFFNRVDRPSVKRIGVKDFIGWCNDPYESISKSPDSSDDAETLGKAIDALNQFDSSELDAMESALRKGAWGAWCETEWSKISQAKKLKPKITTMKKHPENTAFYLVLKRRTDDQAHYHFYFDKDSDAEIDAFDPFKGNTSVLDQQWHVLISVLAFLDVAHALSNEQYEYHCLYQYIKKWDKIDLNADELEFYRGTSGKPELRFNTKEGEMIRRYKTTAMNKWLETALRRP